MLFLHLDDVCFAHVLHNAVLDDYVATDLGLDTRPQHPVQVDANRLGTSRLEGGHFFGEKTRDALDVRQRGRCFSELHRVEGDFVLVRICLALSPAWLASVALKLKVFVNIPLAHAFLLSIWRQGFHLRHLSFWPDRRR